MERRILVFGTVLSLAAVLLPKGPHAIGSTSASGVVPEAAADSRILAELARMVKSHETYLSVPVEDGKALRLLTEAADAKQVVEIGTSTGYSGLWFSFALARTHGHLTTFEIDHQRASSAREHFQRAGVEKLITVIEGDAHQEVTNLKGSIDVAFIDADKAGYLDYLHKLLPLVRPGGLILAHNIEMAPDYLKAVTSDSALETILYTQGAGMSVSLKKR